MKPIYSTPDFDVRRNSEQFSAFSGGHEGSNDLINSLSDEMFDAYLHDDAIARRELVYASTLLKINRKKYYRKIVLWRSVAMASSVLFAVFLFSYLFNADGSVATPQDVVVCSSAQGVTEVTLPDGTIVSLNSNTSLKYTDTFNGKLRDVYLDGEAFFDVRKDPRKAFIVHVGSMKVVVTGTRFNLMAYQNCTTSVATLEEGSILVELDRPKGIRAFTLTPDQQFLLDKESGGTSIRNVNALAYSSWKKGELYFENEPFYSIVQRLETLYDTDIHILSSELKNLRFSGVFSMKHSLDDILYYFSKHNKIRYRSSGDTIVIYSQSTP